MTQMRDVLTRLVDLHDGPRDEDYKATKAQAWRDAREVIRCPTEHEVAFEAAMALIVDYGMIDGTHHKQWLLDQIVRTILGEYYDLWLASYNESAKNNNCDLWDQGIEP